MSFAKRLRKILNLIWGLDFFFIVLTETILMSQTEIAFAEHLFPRVPSSFNPNPVAGRLYVQGLENFDDRVLVPFIVESSYSQIAEYNFNFHPAAESWSQLMNVHMIKVHVSQGHAELPFLKKKIEFGMTHRFYIDDHQTSYSQFLKSFHKVIDSPKEIPAEGTPYG
ncbi:MAG: hypothetical protein KA436_10165, partial [Oligoflexales bacterium]|nr:hypothetical protein [Oligoflexales bacterium]